MTRIFKASNLGKLLVALTLAAVLTGCRSGGDDTAKSTPSTGGAGTQAAGQAGAAQEPLRASDVGITPTEIVLGSHQPLSGPASSYNVISRAVKAYFDHINETEGGVHGRKIVYKFEDDGYVPNNTVTIVKKLVEQDKVFAIFNGLGTPTHSAVVDYLNDNKVPDMYIASGAAKWGEPVKKYVFGFQPDYVSEGRALAKYIQTTHKGKKVGMIYQNDDFGKDYVRAMKGTLGADNPIVAEESHEVTAADLNSQVANLRSKGAEVIGLFVVPKFAGIGIRTIRDQGMTQPIIMTSVSADPTLVELAGGVRNVEGVITAGYLPQYDDDNDPKIKKHKEIMAKYAPGLQIQNFTVYGHAAAETMVETLKQAGRNPTRDSLIQAAEGIKCFKGMAFSPVSMGADDHRPLESIRLERIENGKYVYFGDIIKTGNDEKVTC